MSEHGRRQSDIVCPQHEPFVEIVKGQYNGLAKGQEEIKSDVKTILRRMGDGDVNFATIMLRVRLLELVVYGALGIALIWLLNKALLHIGG